MSARIDAETIEALRKALEQRRETVAEEIRRELAESETRHYAELAGVGDLEDHALADLLVDENLAEIHHAIQEHRAIDAALARMDRGEYGDCVDCVEPIAVERLRVYPTAVRCIECQERFERTTGTGLSPTL